MADYIRIRDLEVYANHGVFEEENRLGQKFLFSFELEVDMKRAGITDDLSDSVHYGEICRKVYDFTRAHTYHLLEKLAESVSRMLLMEFPEIRSLKTEIKKPWAPVRLPLKTVSVEIERGWHTAYIALGSNMGDRENYLNTAVRALDEIRGCSVRRVSHFLETPPYGVTDQADFLNGCLELKTLLPPRELLDELHRIEQGAGRERTLRWGPRTLDLDIIFYDNQNKTLPIGQDISTKILVGILVPNKCILSVSIYKYLS